MRSKVLNADRERTFAVTSSFASMALEILDLPFVLFRSFACLEGAEVSALSGTGIFLAGVQAVLT
jgi:hypothetical protein